MLLSSGVSVGGTVPAFVTVLVGALRITLQVRSHALGLGTPSADDVDGRSYGKACPVPGFGALRVVVRNCDASKGSAPSGSGRKRNSVRRRTSRRRLVGT